MFSFLVFSTELINEMLGGAGVEIDSLVGDITRVSLLHGEIENKMFNH